MHPRKKKNLDVSEGGESEVESRESEVETSDNEVELDDVLEEDFEDDGDDLLDQALVAEPKSPTMSSLFNKSGAKKHLLPKLNGGLDAMLVEVQRSDELASQREAPALTLAALEKAWEHYVEENEQPDAVKMLLGDADLKLEAKKITVVANSSLAENAIKEEKALVDYLRTYFQEKELIFSVIRNPDRKEKPQVKKLLSAKDKYLKMRETNPLLQELQKRFDLRPDGD